MTPHNACGSTNQKPAGHTPVVLMRQGKLRKVQDSLTTTQTNENNDFARKMNIL